MANSSDTRYTMIYQDATSLPNDNVGGQAFNLSNPVPAGLIEQIGFRIVGTCAAYPSTASAAELVSGLRFTLNGDQLFNYQIQGSTPTNAGVSRLGAMLQDIGGGVV